MGILPRELAQRLTWRDLMGWEAYFVHMNPDPKRAKGPNLLDDPDLLVREMTRP